MGIVFFVSLGLCDATDLTLRGLNVLKSVDEVYLERYTSFSPSLKVDELEEAIGREVKVLYRDDLEGEGMERFTSSIGDKKVAILVMGDPFVATTHVALRCELERLGHKVKVVHNASIFSAAFSSCGLSIYKAGRPVTVMSYDVAGSFLKVVEENLERGLHTLLLLELNVTKEGANFLSIADAIRIMLKFVKEKRAKHLTEDKLVVGLARIGCTDEKIAAGKMRDLLSVNFGGPPHCMIIPGELHFLEEESLKRFTVGGSRGGRRGKAR